METLDPAGEFLRLSERYRQMSDTELLVLARQSSELTEVAQQALASEISHRGLKPQPEEPSRSPPFAIFEGWDSRSPKPELPPAASHPADSSYLEERELVELCTVWSLPDALQVQTLLDRAGIPFFMGPERTTGVAAVTSNFVNGVSVQIMKIGLPWARQAMQNYAPANEPPEKPELEPGESQVRCPKCHSTEVVFERLTNDPATVVSAPNYQWTCDSCGHQWEDDGIVREE
jgi:DNA-directed RNA polymerase subunit M/transcription elongation factor TFIIS